MTTAVVVPTNRPERIAAFCEAWAEQFNRPDVRLIVVEDSPTFTEGMVPEWVEHYYWGSFADMLPATAAVECIPKRSGGVRDFGFYLAAKDPDVGVMVTLDDDVAPACDNLIQRHRAALDTQQNLRWFATAPFPVRGWPYSQTQAPTVLNHGLWRGVPDLDAYHQMQVSGEPHWDACGEGESSRLVSPGQYFPLCIMNVAVRREQIPLLWMPSLPDGMKRWDDMWAGVILKRVADLYGWAVISGAPIIHHTRASLLANNLRQEMLGYGIHEQLWQVVDRTPKCVSPLLTWQACWHDVAVAFPQLKETARLARMWASLWPEVAQ